MKKAYQYIRYAAQMEDCPEGSFCVQQKVNVAFAKKNRIEIAETFIDAGYSGRNFNRPGWKALENKLKKNKVDYVLITNYDRITRSPFKGLEFIKELEQKWKVKLLSATQFFN